MEQEAASDAALPVRPNKILRTEEARTYVLSKPPNEIYNIGKQIGYGSHAKVYEAIDKSTGETFALKHISKRDLEAYQLKLFNREIEILSSFRHDSVIQLYATYQTEHDLYLVLEMLEGGELFDRIVAKRFFEEHEAKHAMRMIVSAVACCHDSGIVHRDLKPENMLYQTKRDDSALKICDFGLARFASESDILNTPCGTPEYIAPEVLSENTYQRGVDMWSIGVILYTLLCGFPPFYSADEEELLDLVIEGDYQFPDPYWDGVSESAKNLIGLLLEKDPTKRLTAKQTLEHPWMKEDTPSTTTSAVPPAPHAEHQPPKPSLRESAERPENKNVLRQSLNRSIEVQRDGIHNLKSVSESSLLKKRMQASLAGQTQGEDNAQDCAGNATDNNNGQQVQVLWSSQE